MLLGVVNSIPTFLGSNLHKILLSCLEKVSEGENDDLLAVLDAVVAKVPGRILLPAMCELGSEVHSKNVSICIILLLERDA